MADKRLSLEELNKVVDDLVGKVGLLNDRMRLIEEHTHQNREKTRIIEENVIIKFKAFRDDVRRLTLEVDSLRKNTVDLTKTLQHVVKDLATTAKLSDVAVIEKVLDFFDPTRYLTEKDVNKIISERVR